MDLGRLIRRGVRAAVEEANRIGPTNTAIAANIGQPGQSTAVSSDGQVTVVQWDGHTEVFHHDDEERDER